LRIRLPLLACPSFPTFRQQVKVQRRFLGPLLVLPFQLPTQPPPPPPTTPKTGLFSIPDRQFCASQFQGCSFRSDLFLSFNTEAGRRCLSGFPALVRGTGVLCHGFFLMVYQPRFPLVLFMNSYPLHSRSAPHCQFSLDRVSFLL